MAAMKFKHLALAALTAASVSAAPAAASADAVDDLLAKMPAGPISCEQAQAHWTNASDYANKRSQAMAVAAFHPRGGEIRAAVANMDEAVARCGLNGVDNTGGNQTATRPADRPANNAPAPANNAPANNAPANNAPAQPASPAATPLQQALAKSSTTTVNGLPVFELFVIPGQPTVDVPVANLAIVRVPDVAKIIAR